MAKCFYEKADYINQCGEQLSAYEAIIKGLKSLLTALPAEDGKRFDKRNLGKLNKENEGTVSFAFYDAWDNVRELTITAEQSWRNRAIITDVIIRGYDWFSDGKINHVDEIKESIKKDIAEYSKSVEQFKTVENKVDEYQAKYAEFYKAYKALDDMKMPFVGLGYISEKCPIY